MCFGGTSCDAALGHGKIFKHANVPYEDVSNTRFCGVGWAEAGENCSVETHCPDGSCPTSGMTCYTTSCNVQDMVAARLEKLGLGQGGNGDSGGDGSDLPRMDAKDPRRHNFCGMSWEDANSNCGQWCSGLDDSECPSGQVCYSDTNCYYDADFVPTASPTTHPPSSSPTLSYGDPANSRFCGSDWSAAKDSCSIETHCRSGSNDDCPQGQSCHGGLPCNIIDLMRRVRNASGSTPFPTMPPVGRDHPSNQKFCGQTWSDAAETCSLETHCPSGYCQDGLECFESIPNCNAYDMKEEISYTNSSSVRPTTPIANETNTIAPSLKPSSSTIVPPASENEYNDTTASPSSGGEYPSVSPDSENFEWVDNDEDEQNWSLSGEGDGNSSANLWCGTTQFDATRNCGIGTPCSNGVCPGDLKCFMVSSRCDTGPENVDVDAEEWHERNTTAPTPSSPENAATNAPAAEPNFDESDTFFCGVDQADASASCRKRCRSGSHAECPNGTTCFGYTTCTSEAPTAPPIFSEPTTSPVTTPTAVDYGLCAANYTELQRICWTARECSSVDPCSDGELCFENINCNTTSPQITSTLAPTPSSDGVTINNLGLQRRS